MTRKAWDYGATVLVVAPSSVYWFSGAHRWPTWVAVPVACAVSAGIILASVAWARHWRGVVERYLGVPETGEAPRDFRAWRQAIRAEAARRYGPVVARMTVRVTGRILLGSVLFYTTGVVAVCSLAGGSPLGELAGGGACMVVGGTLSWIGVLECRAALATARTAGIERGAMQGLLMARVKYLRWYEENGQDPYPFGRLLLTDFRSSKLHTLPGAPRDLDCHCPLRQSSRCERTPPDETTSRALVLQPDFVTWDIRGAGRGTATA